MGAAPSKTVGQYTFYGEIGSGGMATVHYGRLLGSIGFARPVAIKRLHPQFVTNPDFVSMFLDEARVAARVQHPNVVSTLDVVSTEGELFLIMDYVRGETLSRLVRGAARRGERIPPAICASITYGLLQGLHAAHEAKDERGAPLGIVHRDVSPQNVLVGADGIARVVDFGVAKAAGRLQVTRDGEMKGKLAYMSPEQLRSKPVSRSADIYAAGVVFWEVLTGERLFKGKTEGATLSNILRGVITPASLGADGVPPAYDDVIARALLSDPEKRFPTAREMARQIARCGDIAPETDVAEWVERIAGKALEERASRIADMERGIESVRPPAPSYADESSSFESHVRRAGPQTETEPPRSASSSDDISVEVDRTERMPGRPASAALSITAEPTVHAPRASLRATRAAMAIAAAGALLVFVVVALALFFFPAWTTRGHVRGCHNEATA